MVFFMPYMCVPLLTRIVMLLQNIKDSDIECIKELGSGTFGTVYYGKWKGSDVAIKRIKPSCFTDGAKEEDRLVITIIFHILLSWTLFSCNFDA